MHLWEVDHSYYCNEGNFFKAGLARRFESWAEFATPSDQTATGDIGNLLYDFDDDLNLLWRWDWKHYDREVWAEGTPEEEVQEAHDVLMLFFMLQRKAYNMSAEVLVTADDEPEIRVWLTAKAQHMRNLWFPLLEPEPIHSRSTEDK